MFHLKEHKQNYKKSWFQRIIRRGGGGAGKSQYMPDYFRSPFSMAGHLGFWLGNNYFALKLSKVNSLTHDNPKVTYHTIISD